MSPETKAKPSTGSVAQKAPSELRFHQERTQFKSLLLANPNYFGNLKESGFQVVKKIVSNTSYEQLTCIGFSPNLNLLEATIQIKLASGFSGELCGPGSTEYVRFYIDYGGGWQDLGAAGFNTHDIPNIKDCAGKPDKPLSYVVTLPFEPKRDFCGSPLLPSVRGVLSWQSLPPANDPTWIPVWGNVLDQHIQIKPRPTWVIDVVDVLAKSVDKKLKLPPQLDDLALQEIPHPEPPPVELADLAKMYQVKSAAKAVKGKSLATMVEPHRFGLAHIQKALNLSQVNPKAFPEVVAQWKALGIDWSALIAALEKTSGDVSYEELTCLGLDYNREWLYGTFVVKKPSGFSGDLCSPGSKEYVAFWADWNNTCEWKYLGTTTVEVHDISGIPADGLHYAAVLPVNLDPYRQSCELPKISRVRAVLSWNTPPSVTDPNAIPYWGNRLDTHVQIKPGEPTHPGEPPKAAIRALGGINIEDIDTGPLGNGMTKAGAKFWYYETPADPWGLDRACPFGGVVWVEGKYLYGYKYRVSVRKESDPPSSVTYLTNSFNVRRADIGSDPQTIDGAGFFTYKDPLQYLDSRLAWWSTSGDEVWVVQLEVANMFDVVVATSPEYRLQLDNTAPLPVPIKVPPTIDIHIDGSGDCMDFTAGDLISGHFVAQDVHFGGFSLSTLPNTASIPSNQPTTAQPSTSPTAGSPGAAWVLNTASPVSMKPCGYVVRLEVFDRSIVGSQPGSHNWNHIETGLCLRKK